MSTKWQFPEQLKKMHERTGQSIQDTFPIMAEKIGVSERTVFDLFHGRWAKNKIETIGKVCDYLGCTPNDLLGYKSRIQITQAEHRKMISKK